MRFTVLGPISATGPYGSVDLGPPRHRQLLALLLLHAGETVTIDRIIDAVWEENPVPSARDQVINTAAALRRTLAAADDGHTAPITRATTGYTFTAAPGTLDLAELDTLQHAARVATDPADAARHLRTAADLWHGDSLTAVTGRFFRAAAQRLDDRRLTILEDFFDLELHLGRSAHHVTELETLTAAHPYRERLTAQLMHSLDQAGRTVDALHTYRRARTRIRDDLGIEPGHALTDTHRTILQRPRPPHRDTPAAVPVRDDLPNPPPDFVGRAGDLDRIDALADAGLIAAVTGTAGVGKTAVALHWAHHATDRFPDGRLYLNLHGHAPDRATHPIDALSVLLRALGTRPENIPVDIDEATAAYRAATRGRRILILLDNAAGADQIRPLLPAGSTSFAIITSRQRLTPLIVTDGVRRIDLDALTPDDATALLRRILGPRVDAEPAAATAIADACARLPLALRIIAANLLDRPATRLDEYATEIHRDRITTMRVDGDETASVHAASDLSYTALDPDARRTLRYLGLVPGLTLPTDAVAALTSTTTAEADRILRRMHEACLVDRDPNGRYRCHDLLGDYAVARLAAEDASADTDAALDHLTGWYLTAVHRAAAVLYPHMLQLDPPAADTTAPRPTGTAWLEREYPNLIALARIAAVRTRPAAWRIPYALAGYFRLTWRHNDWLTTAELGLTVADTTADPIGQAASHQNLGLRQLSLARTTTAIRHFHHAETAATRADWPAGLADATCALGAALRHQGDFDNARRHLTRAADLASAAGYIGGQASALGELGTLHAVTGPLTRAADYTEQAIACHARQGDAIGKASFQSVLAEIHRGLGRFDDAIATVLASTTRLGELDDKGNLAAGLAILADLYRDAGRPTDALAAGTRAYDLATQVGEVRAQINALNALGNANRLLGNTATALPQHQRGLALARHAEHRYCEAVALLGIAAIHHTHGDHTATREPAVAALALAHTAGYRLLETEALLRLADLPSGDESTPPDEYARSALALAEHTGHVGHLRRARHLSAAADSTPTR
jgi:DNA-binding SARP family transcriptional activator